MGIKDMKFEKMDTEQKFKEIKQKQQYNKDKHVEFLLSKVQELKKVEDERNKYVKIIHEIRRTYETGDENDLDELLYGLFTNEVEDNSY